VTVTSPGTGLDRRTGAILTGWPHVQQSLEVIFSTRIGERVIREWFGSMVPAMLGENLTVDTVLRTKLAIWVAIELWEPRFRVTQVKSLTATRLGEYRLEIEGEYRPRAHLGDFSIEGPRRVVTLGSPRRSTD
jgi:phage baseplate assembly protein W